MTSTPLDLDSRTEAPRRFDWSDLLGKLGPLIGLAFVFALFAVLVRVVPGAQRFANAGNMELMLRQTAVVGTAALGMTLIIVSGGIDLSVAANIALSTVVIARIMNTYGGHAPTRRPGACAAAARVGNRRRRASRARARRCSRRNSSIPGRGR